MSCGYACVNCGKCKGKARPLMKPGECPVCHATNPLGSRRCTKCGSPLAPAAGAARGA
ncbi:hypothetical protein K270103H11_09650 [Gordonibacter urolithinfaciens]